MRSQVVSALVATGVLAACPGGTPPPGARPAPPVAGPTAPPVTPPSAPDPYASFNLGFEEVEGDLPRGWAGGPVGYEYRAVTDEVHGGARSFRIKYVGTGERGARFVAIDAAPLAGKRVRVHGWIKTAEVKGAARLFARLSFVDGFTTDAPITGTTGWTEATAEVEIPAGTPQVFVGAMLAGTGTAWFDDLSIEVLAPEPVVPIVLAGTVLDASGAPAAGAEVALLTDHVIRHVTAGADGRFQLDATSGKWGVSAQGKGGVAAFIKQTRYAADARDLTIRFAADGGVTVRGRLIAATAPPGAFIQISPVSEFDADLFAIPVATDGTFTAVLPRGDQYVATMLSGAIGTGVFNRTGDTLDVALDTAVLVPAPQAVVDWIKAKAIPLTSTEAGHGFADMARIGKLVGKARIVGLGEATHGSREFFQLKHRFLEYLVSELGFTVFAIEANQPECRAINAYVLDGVGDARAGLAGIYFWTWDTEEVLAMIEWMRTWNKDPAHKRKVQFVGYDMQTTPVAHATVAAYLDAHAGADAAALLLPIAMLGEAGAPTRVAALAADDRATLVAGLTAAATAFDTNRKAWVAASSAAAYDDARHDLTILQQATEMYAAGEDFKKSFEVRDRSMAANIAWVLEHQPKATRMVVWAHNGHVGYQLLDMRNMGSELKARWKTAYVNLGFLFGFGSFQAIGLVAGQGGELAEHTLPPAPDTHLSAAFTRAKLPLAVLDLRALPRKGPVATWFRALHPVRDTGAVFSTEEAMTVPQRLPDRYDAVIYVEQTTRARPLPRDKPVVR